MTPEEQIVRMTTAIRQAIKVADRFGSSEEDVARAIRELRASTKHHDVERNVNSESRLYIRTTVSTEHYRTKPEKD